ncbi:MAG: tetratricopeptide repeat protein [Acidobacteriaceae bacterium]
MKQNVQNDSRSAEELFRDAELREERGDFRGAFRSLLIAAKKGDILSQLSLGNYYAFGRGVRKDLRESARWHKRVYRNGGLDGALNLSVNLEKQGNTRGAIAWLKRAVAMNDGDAHVRLAKIYLKSETTAPRLPPIS